MDLEQERRMLQNYRGRRLLACRAMATIEQVITHIGCEDGSQLPIPDHTMPPAPSAARKREMKNIASALLRMILVENDGMVSAKQFDAL